MKTHYLKTVQPFFSEVNKGIKTFELRRNDRDFHVGDEVYLQEYDLANNSFSGHEVKAIITYILKDWKGLDEGYCVFAIEVTQQIDKNVNTETLV